jgi:hypothetical protein
MEFEIFATCPETNDKEKMDYEIRLVDIWGGDFEYGYQPGCKIRLEISCPVHGIIVGEQDIEL